MVLKVYQKYYDTPRPGTDEKVVRNEKRISE